MEIGKMEHGGNIIVIVTSEVNRGVTCKIFKYNREKKEKFGESGSGV